eukprot:GEMP01018217.1.p1 GENE.GEMP01018217.1~~GEMP01018217.1.p1  ORF type:complete len:544 (+),score=165.50 GEMP01018217.1:138-1769(+)
MRWTLAVLAVIADPFKDHVASLKAQSPWRNGVSALNKVFDSVVTDLQTQQTFQKDKKAYCRAQYGATKRRMADAKSSTNILTNDRVQLEAEVEGLQGEVGGLEEKLAGIHAEIESTQAERRAEEKTDNEDVIALKAAVVSADYTPDQTGARDVLNTRLLALGTQHRKMVAILIEFANQKRSAMLKVEEELQLKRTEVLEKQTALAEVVRTMNDNTRTLTRDTAYLKALKHECEVFSKNEQKLKKSRTRLRDLLGKSIALMQEKVKEAQDKTALMQDMRSPPTPSFLQIRARSHDVFDDVRRRIQEMLRQMESNMNKDKDRHEWCTEEKKSNDRDRQKYQDQMSTHQSAIRRIKDQMAAAVGSQAFAHEMATENMKIVDRAKDEISALDGRFKNAIDNVDTLVHVVTEVENAVKTLDGSTKVFTYLGEAKGEAERLRGLLNSAKSETKITLDEVRENAEKAMEARQRDAQDVDLRKAELQDALVDAEADYNMSKKNLGNAREYQETIASDCGPANADMAAKRRNEEIEALQDALKVLNGEEIPT